MATNFGTKIAINWFCVDDSDYAIGYDGGLSDRRQNADIADTLYLSDVAMATTFCLSIVIMSLSCTVSETAIRFSVYEYI